MIRPFIIDKEISLSKENDLLKTKTYADTLTKLIVNTPKNRVFTIGLFGNWGTGKSSIVETSKFELEQQNTRIKFITYDAWKYCSDSFRRMFLLKLREELHYEETDLMKKFYSNESTDIDNKYQLSPTRLSFILGGLILLVGIITLIPFNIEFKVPIYAVFTLLGLLITIITGAFHQLKISVTKPHLFAPEQFEECFKEIVYSSLSKNNRILKWIKGDNSIQGLEKLVVVIDNIDRCDEAMAYQLLTDIKTFLSNEEYNVVFVVPVDDEALKKHLFEKSKGDACNKEKEEFLRKFFNISLRIKPHQPTEMQSFTHSINNKYELGYNSDTLALAAKEYATNPRRIIQLLNNLSSELTMYSDDFAERNQSIICASIILKEEFYDFYKQTIDDVRLLIDKFEDALKGDDNIKKQTLTFMRSANVYFRNAKLNDILTILTNTNEQFTSIPNDVKESIRKFDIENVLKFINNNNAQLNTIVSYIIESTKTDVKYSSISQLTNWLDFVAKFNLYQTLSRSTLATLDNMMKANYTKTIKLSQNSMEICQYANTLDNLKLPSLKKEIIAYISSDNDDEKPTNKDSYIKSVLSVFNNEVDSKTLESFADKYYQNNWIDKSIDYTEAQKEYLFTDSQIINRINTFDSIVNESESNEIKWLFENKPNISTSTYGEFFSHVNNMLGDMRNKTKEVLLAYIRFIIPYVCLIKKSALEKEPSELYIKLFEERGIARPGYPNSPQYDSKVNLMSECLNEEEYIDTIAKFCYEVYRTTNNNTETKEQFKGLFTRNKPLINSLFVNLLNLGFGLIPLFSIILTDDDYSDYNNYILTKNCFTQRKSDGSLYLTSDQIRNKIKSLIDNVHNTNVTELIMQIVSNEDIKSVFIEDITDRDSEYINSLPDQLLTLAIDAFDENTSANYINNYTYLGIVAEKGFSKQRSEIVRILNSNFSNKKDIQGTICVFEKMGTVGKSDKNIIIAQVEKYIESHNSEIESNMKDKIETLLARFKPTTKKETKRLSKVL